MAMECFNQTAKKSNSPDFLLHLSGHLFIFQYKATNKHFLWRQPSKGPAFPLSKLLSVPRQVLSSEIKNLIYVYIDQMKIN